MVMRLKHFARTNLKKVITECVSTAYSLLESADLKKYNNGSSSSVLQMWNKNVMWS